MLMKSPFLQDSILQHIHCTWHTDDSPDLASDICLWTVDHLGGAKEGAMGLDPARYSRNYVQVLFLPL